MRWKRAVVENVPCEVSRGFCTVQECLSAEAALRETVETLTFLPINWSFPKLHHRPLVLDDRSCSLRDEVQVELQT